MAAGFQAAPSSAEGSQAASSSAEDEIEALYKKMAGSWDTHYRAAGARTLSGLKNSSFDAFLYKRRIIFPERVQAEASGMEVNSNPDTRDPHQLSRQSTLCDAVTVQTPGDRTTLSIQLQALGNNMSRFIIRNQLLEESSSAVLLVKSWLDQKIVDDRELYSLDQHLAPPGDAAESDKDMEVERQALGEGMDAQQEENFDSGSDLTDVE
ncbi:hypothetical protein FN846DRAFT_990259 [Sphaerosporella brunnea]|uniref:Uncharacterized protein n=1 Tax=Sphaerosporella brunnea TaxID=1250544 RepID=A0A5J5EQC4_9PEZI|nr:hypothetical protein FN846DRAFT_990259 [Sphaerosporella brunnea]